MRPELTDNGIVLSDGNILDNDNKLVKIVRRIQELAIDGNSEKELAKYNIIDIHETVGFKLTEDEQQIIYETVINTKHWDVGNEMSRAVDFVSGEGGCTYSEYCEDIPKRINLLIQEDAKARGIDTSDIKVISEYVALHSEGMDSDTAKKIDDLRGRYEIYISKRKSEN